jgi:NADH:ubiquinone oxidoreductase subunit E
MPNPATAAQTGKRTRRSLPAQEIGARFVADVSGIPDVLAVGVTSFGNAFRIVTVIDAYDMDVCEQVFCRESKLYELAPDLEAEFLVLARDWEEARALLEGDGQDFLWTRK